MGLEIERKFLDRFISAQDMVWDDALAELHAGEKQSHWMWYIFPQILGLGFSSTSQYYGIRDLDEARDYLAHPVLGARLREAMAIVLSYSGKKSAEDIFGGIDAMKLKSSATLFDLVEPNALFAKVLDAFYGGERCKKTREIVLGK